MNTCIRCKQAITDILTHDSVCKSKSTWKLPKDLNHIVYPDRVIKLTAKDVKEIKELHAKGYSEAEIANMALALRGIDPVMLSESEPMEEAGFEDVRLGWCGA